MSPIIKNYPLIFNPCVFKINWLSILLSYTIIWSFLWVYSLHPFWASWRCLPILERSQGFFKSSSSILSLIINCQPPVIFANNAYSATRLSHLKFIEFVFVHLEVCWWTIFSMLSKFSPFSSSRFNKSSFGIIRQIIWVWRSKTTEINGLTDRWH